MPAEGSRPLQSCHHILRVSQDLRSIRLRVRRGIVHGQIDRWRYRGACNNALKADIPQRQSCARINILH